MHSYETLCCLLLGGTECWSEVHMDVCHAPSELSPCRATVESAKALAVLVDGHEANRAQALRAGAASLLLRMVAAVARAPSQAQQPSLFEAACEWVGECLARNSLSLLTMRLGGGGHVSVVVCLPDHTNCGRALQSSRLQA